MATQYHETVWIDVGNVFPKPSWKDIRKMLKTLLDEKKRCPNCGGLVPELGFEYEGKLYRFTCTEISEPEHWTVDWETGKDGPHTPQKFLVQTDWAKLGAYCKAKEKKE